MTLASLFRGSVAALWSKPTAEPAAVPTIDPLDLVDAPADVRRLIRERRYCKVLAPNDGLSFDEESQRYGWQAVRREMALVPGGEVSLLTDLAVATEWGFEFQPAAYEHIPVNSVFMDRHPVTNADYRRFVASGGYTNPELWPADVLPSVLQFVDRTGSPGPKYWVGGKPPEDKLDHPVVGVCWYEANAYAVWAAKRLPTSAEWQRAGTWGKSRAHVPGESRYPWGDVYDPGRANTWPARRGGTVSVQEFSCGATPNGICQLIGNVWEWIDAQFTLPGEGDVRLAVEQPLAEIRGGAYDTYFHSQASCQFRTGQPLLHRAANVGFRCCVSTETLPNEPAPEQHSNDPPESNDGPEQ